MYSYQQVLEDLTVIANQPDSDLYNNPSIFKALKEYSNFYFIQLFSEWIKKKATLEVGEQVLKEAGSLVTVNFFDYFGECAAVANPNVLPNKNTLYFVYRVDRLPEQDPNEYKYTLLKEVNTNDEVVGFFTSMSETHPEVTCAVLVSIPDCAFQLLSRKIH